MPVTSPDSIYFSDTTTTMDPNAISAAQATSMQAALALRQRFDFVWANAAARTAQAGMTNSSTGYQVDTKTEYIYESAAWRLKTPYAEFTATKSIASGVFFTPVGVFANSPSTSTSTVMATAGGTDGQIVLVDPGLYIVTYYATFSTSTTGRTFVQVSTTPSTDVGNLGRVALPNGEDRITITLQVRTAAANSAIYFIGYQNNGSAQTWSGRASILRVG